MTAKAITTSTAPAPVGPYNQAVLAGDGCIAQARSPWTLTREPWWATVMWPRKPVRC